MIRKWMTLATPIAALLVTVAIPVFSQKAVRPAPTAADWAAIAKLPDLTGVWEAGPAPRPAGAAAPAAGPGAAKGAAPVANAAGPGAAKGAPGPGAAKGGGRGAAAQPQLTPEYAAKAKQPTPPGAGGEQAANCLPPGLPGIMGQPYPYQFLMTPGLVTIISEAYSQVRNVYTDGRTFPADLDPSFYGFSIGKWEGDTLTVETTGFAQVPRGLNFPYSDKLKIIEKIKLSGPDSMTIETSAVDPDALIAPFTLSTRTLQRHRSWTLAEYVCEENNRNFVDANGNPGTKLTNPLSSAK